ncbi:hypothetical protein EIQ06_04520 [Xanthomonas campestris pv. campestris]|jgi:hypothetical protein|uniref:hypothetical protein n=1 Tax=Xanthomonas campestris TaxID=339 RepID=UPI00035F2DCF|nr:hypothetical protein [Xanthomonas campestris]MCD0253614.1 hypothetical protein [Xanthomonas campestris pv. campestris]MCD0260798.1 hypothetical protein [Xanthomonas campestris pv. campestris]MCD0269049.1 hypothetical protein [Xanthomonas campestris pv. campestris]MCD0275773.1 hypothetical protein [Xanthomonas campestris pv. campestris]MCF8789038.1 hypothetical protein [Xanthomonas campestris pv. campestris]
MITDIAIAALMIAQQPGIFPAYVRARFAGAAPMPAQEIAPTPTPTPKQARRQSAAQTKRKMQSRPGMQRICGGNGFLGRLR